MPTPHPTLAQTHELRDRIADLDRELDQLHADYRYGHIERASFERRKRGLRDAKNNLRLRLRELRLARRADKAATPQRNPLTTAYPTQKARLAAYEDALLAILTMAHAHPSESTDAIAQRARQALADRAPADT